jgi:ribosomal protein L31
MLQNARLVVKSYYLSNSSEREVHSKPPFYTGKQRIIDTENLAKKFEKRSHSINTSQVLAKKAKKIERVRKTTKIDTDSGKLTLKDMLKEMQGK